MDYNQSFRYGQIHFVVYILITLCDVISALQGVVIFFLVFVDTKMRKKARKKYESLKIFLGKNTVECGAKGVSLGYINAKSNTTVENDYEGIRFKRKYTSGDTEVEKRKYSRSTSIISNITTGNTIVAEVYEMNEQCTI